MAKKRKKVSKQSRKVTPRKRLPLYVTLFVMLGLGVVIGLRLWLTPSPTPTVSKAVLVRGEEMYASSCAACHGTEGQGNRSLAAPALNGSMHSWHHNDEFLINQIRNGGMNMPAVGADWDDEDIYAVISYFKQWWNGQQRRSQQGSIGE